MLTTTHVSPGAGGRTLNLRVSSGSTGPAVGPFPKLLLSLGFLTNKGVTVPASQLAEGRAEGWWGTAWAWHWEHAQQTVALTVSGYVFHRLSGENDRIKFLRYIQGTCPIYR